MATNYKIELNPVSFIAGDYQEFQYNVINAATGTPIDISAVQSVSVALFPYGDNETPALVVDGEVIAVDGETSAFLVALTSAATKNLNSGLYIQQPIIIDGSGKEFRPGQGQVNILPRAHEENAITTINAN